MPKIENANQGLLDRLFESAAKQPRSVTANLVIDGGEVGRFELEFLVNQKLMTRLNDLINDLPDDYSTGRRR